MHKYNYAYLLPILLLLFATDLTAQGTQTEFGKNRVQYHDGFDEWSKYESDNFITYWYGEGRFIGQAVVQFAEYDFYSIQNILEHRINEKIQIIVYADLTDLKQSNIGTEETFTNTGGQTKIVGNKVFVYFDGNHNNLRRQVREGIASVYLNAMLFGSNLQEIVQNAVMMNLPEWFKQGLVAHVGELWNTTLDNKLRDVIMQEEFEGFDALAEEDPKLAGHSLWYFISENYGQSTVSNLLYLTRINRSIESGFLYVLGSSYEMVIHSWELYFKQRYEGEDSIRNATGEEPVAIKNKRNLPISQVKISPDGTKIVYVTNEIGKYRVYLHDLATGDRDMILKGGFRNAFQATDYAYPMLAWNPSNIELSILYEKRDVAKLMRYDVLTKKSVTEDLSSEYQRVYSIDYVNPTTLVFSAAYRGFSDLFLYFINTRQSQRLTFDFWDDLDARFVNIGNKKGILFASNRQDTLLERARLDSILPINTFDIYYYDLENRSQELVRVTNTPLANERQPVAVDTTYFSYLSDRSGIYNQETGYLEEYIHHYEQTIFLKDGSEIVLHADSTLTELDTAQIDTIVIDPVIKQRAIVHPTSNYRRSVKEQSTARRSDRMAELFLVDGEHKVFIKNVRRDTVITPLLTKYQQTKVLVMNQISQRTSPPKSKDTMVTNMLEKVEETPVEEKDLPEEKMDTGKIDIDNYLFQSEFDEEEAPPSVVIDKEEKKETEVVRILPEKQKPKSTKNLLNKEVYRFRPGRITPYRLEFRTDFVTTQLDNSLLFDGLNSFASNPDGFNYPPPGILLKANFKDLFEDYEFEGGIRIPTTFNGTEYFLVFDDKKRRLDKRFAVYRRNQRFSEESNSFVPNRREANIVLGQFGVRYPLDIFRSLRATATIRRDRTIQLATERVSLETPTVSDQRAGLRLEYVFDNTLDVALNIKNGTRYKIFAEAVKKFDLEVYPNASLNFNEGFMTILGLDARHYQRLDKHSIFALRVAGATSFGSERVLYFMGGVDNWLFNSFNNDIPIPQDGSFAYQTLATNMRGFRLNIRNGNSYALMNSELRVPIFKYISRRIRSSFFRNFQVIGFFDMGTAWVGKDPRSDDNPLNTTTINNGDLVTVQVKYFRDPIVAGYGFGVRSVIFGYFLRLDYAWGIETRQVQDPRLYISLGMDF